MNRISERVNIAACLGLALLILLPIGRAEGASDNASKLLNLARKKFGTLTEAEEKLFRKVVTGELADCSDRSGKNNDPNGAKDWDQNTRVIRAKCIAWLCTDPEASAMVTHKGLLVKGARIDGELDLEFGVILFPLRFIKSAFMGKINLRYAEIRELQLTGTYTRSIDGGLLKVKGNVYLMDGFQAEGEVNLFGSSIGGHLDCTSGKFINKTKRGSERENKAIEATGVNVEGNVSFRNGFESKGTVSLYGATIGKELDCKGGKFTNPGWIAFNGDQMQVNGCVFFTQGFEAEGQVRLIGATIGRDLDCTNGKFFITSKKTANARGLGEALKATGLNVSGNVYLRNGFEAKGTVELVGAKIDGLFDCTGGTFINRADPATDPYAILAIEATGLEVRGSAWLRGDPDAKDNRFRAEGMVSLYDAKIGRDLDCKRGQFINPKGMALCADLLEVNQHVFLSENFHAKGEVHFENAIVNGYLFWGKVHSSKEVKELNLQYARIGMLNIDPNKTEWPNKVLLHGLVYNEISDVFAENYETLNDWLQLQYGDPDDTYSTYSFRPQSYEQLARVLRQSGRNDEARKINIAKERDRALFERAKPKWRRTGTRWDWWIHKIYGVVLDYGFFKWKPFWWGLITIILGCFVFRIGFSTKLLRPTKTDSCPKFNFLVYSLDTFVPLIDLHQSKYWLPDASRGPKLLNIKGFALHTGGLLRLYFWIHIIMGWLLTMLLVAGLTGLIRT